MEGIFLGPLFNKDGVSLPTATNKLKVKHHKSTDIDDFAAPFFYDWRK
jgi:hypothetical protein